MEKDKVLFPNAAQRFNYQKSHARILGFVFLFVCLLVLALQRSLFVKLPSSTAHIPLHAAASLTRCKSLEMDAGPPSDFHKRTYSDRFEPNTRPTLLRNGRMWTGRQNGTEIVHGDILLDKGLIQSVGNVPKALLGQYDDRLLVIDVKGAWVTPGIVDLHSHIGDASSPELSGASYDDNSIKGPILPWLRALDGLNTHDDSYNLSIGGGVTTVLVLPGSANAIGGQGFTIKLRKTVERSPTSMLLEPPYQINTSFLEHSGPPRWRQMKHACGENPSSVYSGTRMDTIWAFREAYNKARQVKMAQDTYCSKALAGHWDGLGEYPEDLQWEALVDVLRGRVKVQTHCYEAVDLDGLVRLSNEFQFPIAAFHHASEAFLVPDLLNKSYGRPPAIALFATQGRYKREAYRASEFAPRILAEKGIKIAMKSDHPVMNSRYLLYEAQQAHYYGLPDYLALASVTSTSAEIMGMDHRIGFLKEGWDADVVVWDSHPLALGATPTQVFIDGIAQLDSPYVIYKPESFQTAPKTPNFDQESKDAVIYEGLPPLAPKKASSAIVLFTNVKSVFTRSGHNVHESFLAQDDVLGIVVVQNGSVVCSGLQVTCLKSVVTSEAEVIDLRGGSISPGLVSFGSPLGLETINQEPSTNDGYVYDPFARTIPNILGGETAVIRAADGLQYATRDALLAYRAGITSGITFPTHSRFYAGLGTFFSTGAMHKLEDGALIQEVSGLLVSVGHFGREPSVSTQIATLRRLLIADVDGEAGRWFGAAAEGMVPLVVETHSADIIATLILLKREVEDKKGVVMKLTIAGASEAYLLAKELAHDNVGVIVGPRPFPATWERRRILPGPPFTEQSAILKLISSNVTVGISVDLGEIWGARNTRFDIAWVSLEAGGQISKGQAIALGSANIEKLLCVADKSTESFDLVATEGGDLLEFESKVVAVISPRRKLVDLL